MYKLRILVTPREIFCFSKVGKCLATNSMAQGPVSHAEYCMVSSIVAKAALSTVLKEGEWIKHWMLEQPEKTTGCSCIWFSKGSFVCKMWQNKARKYWILHESKSIVTYLFFHSFWGNIICLGTILCEKFFCLWAGIPKLYTTLQIKHYTDSSNPKLFFFQMILTRSENFMSPIYLERSNPKLFLPTFLSLANLKTKSKPFSNPIAIQS